ncbi:MAG: type II secretion system major pseudopilin GspG [Candidatus Contendobacter sp.]|nr:type II secretion system major pseudopilin GspG [Candidatus Contendobacter sp.]MDS4057311.1 type II secretion system major pseudopilin GspG [Candidatus Contendobacter sp.]
MKLKTHERRARGFSLIELLVVLVILGLLAGLVGPAVIRYLGGANTRAAKVQIEEFSTALDAFRLDMGRYPNSAEGLAALVAQPSGATRWNGPYLRKNSIPKDSWGNDYQYRSPGQHGGAFDLYSLGADNAEGGDGENQDVVSWQ